MPALSPAVFVPGALAVMPAQMSTTDPVAMAFVIVFLVISLGLHEMAHAWVALKCGDPTARDLGRITVNPIVHIDLFMTILLPAMLYIFSNGSMVFGGAKPVPVAYHRLRKPLRDMMLVAIAGPLTNFLLAILFYAAWKGLVYTDLYEPDQRLPRVLAGCVGFNILLTVFNLIPIPPLDGSRVMRWLLPQSVRESYDVLERFGMLILIVLIFGVPGFQGLIQDGMRSAFDMIHFLTGGQW